MVPTKETVRGLPTTLNDLENLSAIQTF